MRFKMDACTVGDVSLQCTVLLYFMLILVIKHLSVDKLLGVNFKGADYILDVHDSLS